MASGSAARIPSKIAAAWSASSCGDVVGGTDSIYGSTA